MRVSSWALLLLLLCSASFHLANAKKIQGRKNHLRFPTTPPSFASSSGMSKTPPPSGPGVTDSTATTSEAATATTSAEATTTSQTTTEAASIAATATSESTVTASTAAAAGGAQSTTTYASTTSEASTTEEASTTSLLTATGTASLAGPTATNELTTTSSQSTLTTTASVSTTIAQSTSTTATASSTTASASDVASVSSFTSTTATATTSSGLPSDSIASAAASVGFTTFSAISGVSTTGPTIPPATCLAGSACCQFDAPVPNSFCVGTAYHYDNDLVVNGLEATFREPFNVYGSTLVTGSVLQISSPTTINGNLSIDATSVISLTQVAGLSRPLLTIRGSANFAGTISFTLDRQTPLLAPMVRVLEDATISGFVVPSLGSAYPSSVALLSADNIVAVDPEGDGTAFELVVVFNDRPTSGFRKRADPPQVIVAFNASQSLSVPLESAPVTVSKRYLGNECDVVQAPTQQSGNTLTVLVSVRDTCASKGLSKAAIGGIVAGAAVFVVIVATLGILALKKGYCRRMFRFDEKDDTRVV